MTEVSVAQPPSPAPADRARRIRVLWNPAAGSKAGLSTNGTSEEELRDLMRRHGLGEELLATGSEEEAIAAAVANGGAEVEPPTKIGGGMGRFAVVRDPEGSEVGLWQAPPAAEA